MVISKFLNHQQPLVVGENRNHLDHFQGHHSTDGSKKKTMGVSIVMGVPQ